MVTFASLFEVMKPLVKVGLENLSPSFEAPNTTALSRSSSQNPALMAVTYHMVNSRPVAVSQQQQGVAMSQRIAGTVRQVNTTQTTRETPKPVIRYTGYQGLVRTANVSGKQQITIRRG